MAINNPYVPGDPYSYDLKWLVRRIKEHSEILSTLDSRIADAVQQYLDQHDPVYYSNADTLINSEAKPGSLAYIEGFYTPGDFGENLYYITDDYNDVLNAKFYLTMTAPGRWAVAIISTPIVTPEMFGAVGDGVADDTTACQIAITFPEALFTKTYMITEQMECVANSVIMGCGTIIDRVPVGTLQWEHPAVFRAINIKNVDISGLTFIGTGGHTDATIENRSVVKITNCEDVNLHHMKFYKINAGYAIKCETARRVNVDHNIIDEYTFSGVALVLGCDTINVSDNQLRNQTGNAQYSYPITLCAKNPNIIISKNITCCRNIIECTHPNWEAIDAHGGENFTVNDNVIKGAMTGIALMEELTGDETWVFNNATVSGNVIELGTDTTYARAVNNIGIVVNGNDVVISNNVIKNAGVVNAGISTPGAIFVAGNNIIVSDNIVEKFVGHGMRVPYGDNIIIKNNNFKDWTWVVPQIGYTASALLVNCSEFQKNRMFIEHNYVADSPTGAYFAKTFNTLASANNGVIYITNNVMPEALRQVSANNNAVITPYTTKPLNVGTKGDIIWNSNPATGQPKGWICTATYAYAQNGSWASLGNL